MGAMRWRAAVALAGDDYAPLGLLLAAHDLWLEKYKPTRTYFGSPTVQAVAGRC